MKLQGQSVDITKAYQEVLEIVYNNICLLRIIPRLSKLMVHKYKNTYVARAVIYKDAKIITF